MNDFIQQMSDDFEGIYFIEGSRKGRYPFSNSLLVEDVLIDTGISSKHIRKLKKFFSINKVILSHWHEDHVSGNYLFQDVEYSCHIKDKYVIENLTEKLNEYYDVTDTPVEALFAPLMAGLKLINTKIDKTFEDNQLIEVGDYSLKVIHTPGHTAGHSCFFEENSKVGFLADIDLSRFPFYGCIDSNIIDYERSIEKLKKFNMEVIATGHKGIYKGANLIKEKLDLHASIIKEREERILEHLSETNPIKVEDLLKKNIVYKTYSNVEKEYEFIAEKVMIKKHFEKLLVNGLIEKKNNGHVLK